MSVFARKKIEALDDGRVRVAGSVTLSELYEAVPSRELYVEPLSAQEPLSAFLAEGGVGFGSLRNGTFAGQLLRVGNTFANEDGEVKFSYGLGKAPLYNAGYPLQRIMEGPTSDLVKGEFGEASEMVLRTRARAGVAIEHSPSDAPELPRADGAENVFFVNAAAARAIGLSGAGVVKARAGNCPAAEPRGWLGRRRVGEAFRPRQSPGRTREAACCNAAERREEAPRGAPLEGRRGHLPRARRAYRNTRRGVGPRGGSGRARASGGGASAHVAAGAVALDAARYRQSARW